MVRTQLGRYAYRGFAMPRRLLGRSAYGALVIGVQLGKCAYSGSAVARLLLGRCAYSGSVIEMELGRCVTVVLPWQSCCWELVLMMVLS